MSATIGAALKKIAVALLTDKKVIKTIGGIIIGIIIIVVMPIIAVVSVFKGSMNIDPDYHGKTIGRTLINMIKQKYKDYMRIAVIAYDDETHFYENCGFVKSKDASPMFITSLWT